MNLRLKLFIRRAVWRTIKLSFVLFLGALLFALLNGGWRAIGHGPSEARLARMQKSKQWRVAEGLASLWSVGAFENPEPLYNDLIGMFSQLLHTSEFKTPTESVKVSTPPALQWATPSASGLRVTWLGHSTTLIEIDGHRVLTDPIWSHQVTPVTGIGPVRYYPPLATLMELGNLDAVLISHDHYDHMDEPTVMQLSKLGITFVVPLGVGSHLEYWGVPLAQVREMDWWESTKFGDLEIACTPARHASGRHIFDKDRNLWASYSILGPQHRVFYSGDTGLFKGMRDIGAKYGPFDLAMVEVGQYNPAWPDWHIGPEQAVTAVQMVRAKVFLPIHWGLLTLAYHGWTEPIERARAAAHKEGVEIATPMPGQPIEPALQPSSASSSAPSAGTSQPTTANVTPTSQWWPNVPWRTGSEDPIKSTKVFD